MLKFFYISLGFLVALCWLGSKASAQNPSRIIQGAASRFGGMRGPQQGGNDSLTHRTGLEDSITISFRFLDSSNLHKFDSSVSDFTLRYPVPWYHVTLGNLGNATHSLLFSPMLKAGWDPGFHAFDVYNFTLAETRFYTTTRPYAEVGYLLGSKAEQMIRLLHTQNIRRNWNASFQYRMINSPGTFQSQNTNFNHYRFTSWYQGRRKRYQNFIVVLGNKMASAENGGIRSADYLDKPDFQTNQYQIPVNIGNGTSQSRNFFSTNIQTGTFYTNATYLMRQQYDLGQKDSVILNDTTVIPLFYPRLRFEHTISYRTYNYRFKDGSADTSFYNRYYTAQKVYSDSPSLQVYRRDFWRELLNDFSIYQFPVAKNPQQFFKVGVSYQMLKADLDTGTVKRTYNNIFLHAEYRNKTRNQKWDIEAFSHLYLPGGYNGGDYDAHISLRRLLGKKTGYLEAGFENVNRKPSFIFDQASAFYLDTAQSLNTENTTHIFASFDQPYHGLKLKADYFLLSNYTYLAEYFQVRQASALFTVLQLALQKDFHLGRHWHWRTWIVAQQKTGAADLHLPLMTTRNQIAYEGNLGYKNLRISFGGEFRYFTPYRADGYSPVQGQFFYQDSLNIQMRRPEVTAFVHFRIRSFVAYVRAQNLNALNTSQGNFTHNNILIPVYPSPGLQIRVGIFWSFVN